MGLLQEFYSYGSETRITYENGYWHGVSTKNINAQFYNDGIQVKNLAETTGSLANLSNHSKQECIYIGNFWKHHIGFVGPQYNRDGLSFYKQRTVNCDHSQPFASVCISTNEYVDDVKGIKKVVKTILTDCMPIQDLIAIAVGYTDFQIHVDQLKNMQSLIPSTRAQIQNVLQLLSN